MNYWEKDGRRITSSSKHAVDAYDEADHTLVLSLRVRHLTPSDYGTYTCVASNSLGVAQREMTLYGMCVVLHISEFAHDQSRSSKVTPFDSLHMISYYRPIVTLCLECTVFGKKRTPPSFDAPSPANPREYPHKPCFSRNCDPWPTFLPLIVWVYLHSYFRGGLRKTDV